MSKNEKLSKKANEKETQSDYDFQLFFCSSCLQFPEYEIYIDPSGIISLSHKCLDSSVKVKLTELKNFHSKMYVNNCEYCNNKALNICSKCKKFICDNCIEKHEQPKGIINIDYFEKIVIPIIQCENYCKEHLQEITYYCSICKINLCRNCIQEHCHCKPELLISYKNKVSPSGYKGANQTLNQLANIARAFNDCYKFKLSKSKITINTILNLHLIEPINKYIKENDKGGVKTKPVVQLKNAEGITIKNNFKIPKDNVPYVFDSFGDINFNKYYRNIIGKSKVGDIDSFHKLVDIKNHYGKIGRDKNEIISLEDENIRFMKLWVEKEIGDLFRVSLEQAINEYPIIALDIKNQLNKLQMFYDQLKLDFEMLQNFVLIIDYRVDYELRRKIGNIIAFKLINEYQNKIDKLRLTEYLLTLSIEDIENKLRQIQTKIKNDPNNEELTSKFNLIKDKYKNALTQMENLAQKKLNNIQNKDKKDNLSIEKVNTNIRFSSNIQTNNDKYEAVLLNIFFAIKKRISEFFNNNIHNKQVLLNQIVKETINKYENKQQEENDLKVKEENEKSQNTTDKNQNKINNEIILKGQKDPQTQKNASQEKTLTEKICEKINIVYIKKNFPLEKKQEINSLEKIVLEENGLDVNSLLSTFNQHLQDKEKKMFKIISNLDLSDATNLYFKGEKSSYSISVEDNKENDIKKKESEEKLTKIINDSKKSESIKEINNYMIKIKGLTDKFLKYIRKSEIDSVTFLTDFQKYFDFNLIAKEFEITIPLDIYDVIQNIEKKTMYSFDHELYEKSIYLIKVCKFLLYDEFYGFYKEIKEKIKNSKINDIFTLNAAKNELMQETKIRLKSAQMNNIIIENIWENMKTEKFFIENKVINKEVSDYIKKSTYEKFIKDFSSTFGNKVKDINVDEIDPQNLFLKPFMIQQGLYCEID